MSTNPVTNQAIYNPALLSDSPSGTYSSDPKFIKLVDAAWQAYTQYSQDLTNGRPHDANVEALMQAVKALNGYMTTPPTAANDPVAYAMYQAMNAPVPGGQTLATMCASYGTASDAGDVKYFEDQFQHVYGGGDQFSFLNTEFRNYGNVLTDNTNATVKNDFTTLQQDLAAYNTLMQNPTPNPTRLKEDLQNIAADITQLNTDAAAAGVTDGFLVGLQTLLNTTTPSNASLSSLASATVFDPAAFQAALAGLGEGTGGSGSDLTNLLTFAGKWEYGQ